jgi:hypothetical protein
MAVAVGEAGLLRQQQAEREQPGERAISLPAHG